MKSYVNTLLSLSLMLVTASTAVALPAQAQVEANVESKVHQEVTSISPELARIAVLNEIASMSPQHEFYGKWKNVQVTYEYELYDLNDEIVGYYFQLWAGTEKVGYYITSANVNLNPIIEYSATPEKEEFKNIPVEDKIFYFGGQGSVSASNREEVKEVITERIEALNKMSLDQLMNQSDLSSITADTGIESSQTLEVEEIFANLKLDEDPAAPSQWTNLLYSYANSFSAQALPSNYAINVPYISQRSPGIVGPRSACGPTTLAMILEYLGGHGLNVDDASKYNNSRIELVNANRNLTATTIAGTMSGNMVFGLQYALKPAMSGWEVTAINADTSNAQEQYKDRIVSNRPPAVMWFVIPYIPHEVDTRWHWQAGSAYSTSNNTFYFGVKDPDSKASTPSETVYYSWNSNKSGFLFVSYKQK